MYQTLEGLKGFLQIVINTCAGLTIISIGFLLYSFFKSKEGA